MSQTATAFNTYLLEIGTEELPPGFMQQLPELLKTNLSQLFEDADLNFDDITIYITPRRMALSVSGLPDQQPQQTVFHKGPPVRIAFDADNNPTKAAEAFAKKIGVDVAQLQRGNSGKEECLVYTEQKKGLPTTELLKTIVPDLIFSLSGPRFMHWGLEHNGKLLRFPRPIRWLLSLWNDSHTQVTLGTIQSGDTTLGHRFLSNGAIKIDSADTYADQLETQGKVLVQPEQRKAKIKAALQAEAKQLNGIIPPNESLLEEVTQLVEWPWVLQGQIDKKFLDIPKPVIITAMASHQRYFPIEGKQGQLMPYFFTIANGKPEAAENIKKGNQRVLKARLDDARFFYDEDTKSKLESRLDSLKGITFQKGLGTLFDKTQRLIALSEAIAKMLNYDSNPVEHCKRAALLSKCDLTTSMVFEFTELQGEIGQHYAQKEKEPPCVSAAIFEQYLPRYAGESVATTQAGIVLSLADKLDTLVTVFCQQKAKIPTGSKDPLALRRAVNGILQTVLENNLALNITEVCEVAYNIAPQSTQDEKLPWSETWQRLDEFMTQRLKGLLLDEQIPYDVIEAVLATGNPFVHLSGTVRQAKKLYSLTQNTVTFEKLYEPANRIAKILGKNFNAGACLTDIDVEKLKESIEKTIVDHLNNNSDLFDTDNPDEDELLNTLVNLQANIAQFFDDVMVNDPDEGIRQNRLNLLSVLHKAYLNWGLFTKLVVENDKSPAPHLLTSE